MDLKVKRINWMGNIYHKFEAVCQEVDDIVGQDAVKYFENRVQNVGDSVKKFYSGVVHDLLPFPTLASSTKDEAHSVVLNNNIGSSDSNAINLANDQQADAPIKHEVETSGVKKENLHTCIEETATKSTPELMNCESSDVNEEDTGNLAEVSPAASSVSCERPVTKMEPFCSKNCSMVHVCCESSHVAGQIMESQDGLVSSGCCQSMESNDESMVSSIEFSLEDIKLNDDVKLEESCVFVDDSELYAVAYRAQKLRSYKKRIQDAFASKKRLAKEYEQLAIWYGDADMEPSQGYHEEHANNKLFVAMTLWFFEKVPFFNFLLKLHACMFSLIYKWYLLHTDS
ncbi:hypothetical protein SESBI_29266 [Sesbania bispinosa]|nr:hypothetical protein SESBI_29266 [Sesbania bispinosa]